MRLLGGTTVALAGKVRSKFNLRAQNLAASHLEEMKNNARNLALASQWQYVTQSAMAVAYLTPTTVTVEARKLTWTVTSSFVNITTVGSGAASSVTYSTNMVQFVARVDWTETNQPKSITLTGFIANERD